MQSYRAIETAVVGLFRSRRRRCGQRRSDDKETEKRKSKAFFVGVPESVTPAQAISTADYIRLPKTGKWLKEI